MGVQFLEGLCQCCIEVSSVKPSSEERSCPNPLTKVFAVPMELPGYVKIRRRAWPEKT